MSAEREEDYDELPSIIVNSSSRDSCVFVMPSAEALASQRAREQHCERELQALREAERIGDGERAVRIAHSDSSGSEGEAALAGAVGALGVHTPTTSTHHPTLAALLAAVRDHMPPDTDTSFIDVYLRVLRENDARAAAVVTDEILSSISSMLVCDDNEWSDEEVLCVGAWLCAASVAGTGRRRGAVRALHVLLEDRASTAQVSSLGELLGRAWRDSDVRAEAADAARAGAGGGRSEGGALLADKLVRAALSDILRDDLKSNELTAVSLVELPALVAVGWRRLDAAARLALLRLIGRVLVGACGGDAGESRSGDTDLCRSEDANKCKSEDPDGCTSGDQDACRSGDADRCGGGDVNAILDALAAQRTHAAHRHAPEHLQVLVGASKLQLLFGAKK